MEGSGKGKWFRFLSPVPSMAKGIADARPRMKTVAVPAQSSVLIAIQTLNYDSAHRRRVAESSVNGPVGVDVCVNR